MRTRKKYYPQPINNNVYSSSTFDDLLLGKIYNIYGEKVEPYKEMLVVVKFKFEIYLLIENDISKSQNWILIGKCIEKVKYGTYKIFIKKGL